MALVDLTKQLAQQALISATTKEPPPPPQPENVSATFLGQIAAMQKALKEDEELVVTFQHGADRIRVMEVFTPSREVAVLSGADADRNRVRVICAIASLQLVCKVIKVPPGVKPVRVGLINPKP
jgi:hypothetical protein